MLNIRFAWLIAALSLSALAAATIALSGAQAQSPAARICNLQTEKLAAERIAACTRLLEGGRLHGKDAGVVYAQRGAAYLDRSNIANAIADLNLAVTLAPDFAAAYRNRGNALYARGSYAKAAADYDAAIKLDPQSAAAYVSRASVRRDLGNLKGALEDFQKAIDLGASDAKLYAGRAQVFMREHDVARAIADFDHAVRLAPSADNFMQLAQAHEAAGNLDHALRDYRDAIMIDPKRIDAYTRQAAIWRKKKDYDKAIAAYDRAIAADQNQPASYKLRAEAYAAKGDRKRALADFDRALKLNSSAGLLKERAALRLADGDIDGAMSDAETMLKLAPGNADAIALRERIDRAAKKQRRGARGPGAGSH